MVRVRVLLDKHPATDCEFAYALIRGDSFVMDTGDGRVACVVDTVLSVPVLANSGHTPSVVYQASVIPKGALPWVKWQFKRKLVGKRDPN